MDNSNFVLKARIRRKALSGIKEPSIVETNAGSGVIYRSCYSHVHRGVAFETDKAKSFGTAKERPGWAVYRTDNLVMRFGVGFHLRPNFFDVDPYGSCWPILAAIASGCSSISMTGPIRIVVTDGSFLKLKLTGGWRMSAFRDYVVEHGNDSIKSKDGYRQACHCLVARIFSGVGMEANISSFAWSSFGVGAGSSCCYFCVEIDS